MARVLADSRTNATTRVPYTGLIIPGVNGNYASTANSAGLDISTDMEFIMRIKPNSWTASANSAFMTNVIAGKGLPTFGQNTFLWGINPTGTMRLAIWSSTDDVNPNDFTSTASLPLPAGICKWIRATFTQNAGGSQSQVNFYYANDATEIPTVWTQLGSAVNLPIFSVGNRAAVLETGSILSGNLVNSGAVIYRFIWRNGIGTNTIYDADFSQQAPGTTSFTETTGKTVTINQASSPVARIAGRTTAAARTTAGALFNPLTSIPWYAAYWASDPNWTNPGDGNPVASWRDGSGNARDVVQAVGGTQPIYRSSVAALDNKPALEFSNKLLELASGSGFGTLAQPVSVVTVMQWVAPDSSTDVVIGTPTATPFLLRKNTAGLQLFGGSGLASGVLYDSNAHMFAGFFNNTAGSVTVDGLTAYGASGSNSMEGISIGGNNGAASSQTLNVSFVGVFSGDIFGSTYWGNLEQFINAYYGVQS